MSSAASAEEAVEFAGALGRDPTLQAVRDALRRRRGDSTAPIDPAQVRHLLAVVRARLAERSRDAAHILVR